MVMMLLKSRNIIIQQCKQILQRSSVYYNPCRFHVGHSHFPDPTNAKTLTSDSHAKAAGKITWIGIWTNVGLSGMKAWAGVVFHSSGLIADAAHNITDLVSDAITLASVKYCRKPKDKVYPYGYGKYDSLGALAVASVLVSSAAGVAFHSFHTLMEIYNQTMYLPEITPSIGHHHHHHHHHFVEPAALTVAALSIVAKEVLFRATQKVGKKIGSSVLIANAWHHRSDAISSAVALGGIGMSLAGYPLLDPIAGFLVCGIIFKAGMSSGMNAVKSLADRRINRDLLDTVESICATTPAKDFIKERQIHLRGRQMGNMINLDILLEIRPSKSDVPLSKILEFKDELKSKIREEIPNVDSVLIEFSELANDQGGVGQNNQEMKIGSVCSNHHTHKSLAIHISDI